MSVIPNLARVFDPASETGKVAARLGYVFYHVSGDCLRSELLESRSFLPLETDSSVPESPL
jgi:hypothetical protein